MAESASAEARQNALDSALAKAPKVTAKDADDLFAVSDALEGSPQLRRTLTDTTMPIAARQQVATTVLTGKIGTVALSVLTEAIALSWRSGRALAGAIERQAVRATLLDAEKAGKLDEIEHSLFDFRRIVDHDRELRSALANSLAPTALREKLVDSLLKGKAPAQAVRLAKRAVVARDRTYDLTIDHYLAISAALRHQVMATVRVAQPLTAQQTKRLQAVLTAQMGRTVTLMEVIDPDVTGGVRVEMGEQVIDGTVSARYEAARRQIA